MKHFKKLLSAGVFTAAFLMGTLTANAQENLISGGDFENADPAWGIYLESEGNASFSIEDGVLKVVVDSAGTLAHSVQIYYDGFTLLEGAKYQLSFDIASSVDRKLDWLAQMNSGSYLRYAGSESIKVTEEMTHYTYDFTMRKDSDEAPRLCFNLGDRGQRQGLEGHEVTIDNVELILVDDSNAVMPEKKLEPANILVNQVGYRPDDQKTAILRDANAGDNYEIINTETQQSVYQGSFTEELSGGSSQEVTKAADFSDLKTPGTYLIRTESAGDSYPFTIAEDIYVDLLKDSVKMLTLQRCGMELSKSLAGDFAHAACHTELATIYGTDEEIEVSGGWHDAGDYGRYTVPAAKTVADMMLAYEAYPEVFDALDVAAKYSILSEARYELEWMLKMQNAEGGVYHKVTGLNFDGICMPENGREKLYVLPVSLTATGDFAASMYMASRIYRELDPDFADICKAAADKAFSYFEAHKEEKGFTNPSDCYTGEYGDGDNRDEYFWAAAERYKTTKEEEVLELINQMPLGRLNAEGLGWGDMTAYGLYAYLTTEDAPENKTISDAFFGGAEHILKNIKVDSYHSSILNDYPWGSNMTIANNGVLLLMAGKLAGNADYTKAAQTQLDYLLGINTTGYSFVSGYGTLCMKNPHHRPSQTKGHAVPGMLSGGPNNGLQDPCAAGNLKDLAKANCFIDNAESYSTNEVAIYWNSPLIYLIAGVMADL